MRLASPADGSALGVVVDLEPQGSPRSLLDDPCYEVGIVEEIDILITVMLVEDNRVMLDALTYVIGQESGLQLVATAADAEEAITAGRRTQPQVVVMDIRLPGRDGIDATRELCRALPDVRVVILSVSCTRKLVREALQPERAATS